MTTDTDPATTTPWEGVQPDQEFDRAVHRAADTSPHQDADPTAMEAPLGRRLGWGGRTRKRMSRWWYRRLRTRSARRFLSFAGWDCARSVTTFTSSNQAAPLDPLLTATRPASYGDLAGTDLLTFQPLSGSIQYLYGAGVLTAPMGVIIGAIGVRKSSLAKTLYGIRPATRTGTRLAVFDRKAQRDAGDMLAGEYGRLAAVVPHAEVLTVHRDRSKGTRLNLLDPLIAPITSEAQLGQDELLRMVATAALERPMTAEEGFALQAAHHAGLADAATAGRVAILSDVVARLYAPDLSAVPGPRDNTGQPILTGRGIVSIERVTEWGLPVALAFERFLQGDLSGIIDGPTAGPDGHPLNLDAPMLVIDTSALAEGSTALALMMAIISTYLMARWSRLPGFKQLILEEAYAADDLAMVGEVLRALVKRSRGVGAAIIAVMHHLSDLKEGSPLHSLIKEAGVVHIFQQDKYEDAKAAATMFDLPDDMIPTIQTLPAGVHVWKRGRLDPTLAVAFRSPLEAWITDTDTAMRNQE